LSFLQSSELAWRLGIGKARKGYIDDGLDGAGINI
jgi:hypothetical protein